MEVRDYNGTGRWTRLAIEARYQGYCHQLGVEVPLDLSPQEHAEGEVRWVYPVMDEVIDGIEAGDRACIALGIDFIEEDARFAFGKLLKSNTARALRRARLNADQEARIRRRIVDMLLSGNVPHEFKQYAKLLRRIGLGPLWPELENAPRGNPFVLRWYAYFKHHAAEVGRP